MSNAVYGKTIESLRKRIDAKLVGNEKDFKMDIKTNLYVTKIFDNDLFAIRKSKVTLTLNKQAYVGMCMLDMSKVLKYDFHYDLVKNKYGSNSRLLFADTDSLVCEIKTEDVSENFSNDKKMFNFSNYWAESKYYNDSIKLIVFKMKNETGGVAIKEFLGLKPKMY